MSRLFRGISDGFESGKRARPKTELARRDYPKLVRVSPSSHYELLTVIPVGIVQVLISDVQIVILIQIFGLTERQQR